MNRAENKYRKVRDLWRLKGFCWDCGKKKENKKLNSCDKCNTRRNVLARIRLKKYYDEGKCRHCPNRRLINTALCESCRLIHNQRVLNDKAATLRRARIRRLRLKQGFCGNCGLKRQGESSYHCEKCRLHSNETQRIKMRRYEMFGKCQKCSDHVSDHNKNMCEKHRLEYKKKAAERYLKRKLVSSSMVERGAVNADVVGSSPTSPA